MRARHCGLSQETFGRLTIRELFFEFVVFKEQQHREFEMVTLQAYQTVRIWAMTKSKKRMPKFSDLVKREPNGPQTPRQMRQAMETIARQYGWKAQPAKAGG